MPPELISQPQAGEVLDLTTEETKEEEVLDLTGESTQPTSEEPETTETPEVGAEEVSEESDKEEQVEGEEDEPEFYFGDTRVNVEVPEDISAALEEAGIDSSELLSQLFAKDGDFSLNEETQAKLEDKFGKTLVNGYLNMYKGLNEQAKLSAEATKASEEAAQSARNAEYAEAVGGEEGLVAMESYILENLNEKQLEAYNSVMESDNHAAQLLVISQVKSQMELADKLTNGDKVKPLIGDGSPSATLTASPLDKGYLTGEEYQTIMKDDKYWEDKSYAAQVDAARKAGLRK